MRHAIQPLAAAWVSAVVLLALACPAAAQNWTFNARTIALGGAGSSENIADSLIEPARPSLVIPLPIGPFQIIGGGIYDPGSTSFDPIRAVEYIASPIPYIAGRDGSNSGEALFVSDLRTGTLSRDLTRYRGFDPAANLLAEGLLAPQYGHTFHIHSGRDGSFEGLYVGAGPYIAQQVTATFDPRLISVLETGTAARGVAMPIQNTGTGQVAMAITAGLRTRVVPLWGVTSRDGLYIAGNYNYLHGFLYENDTLNANLLTDGAGLLTAGSNLFINHFHGDSGNGYSLDFGVGAVRDRWSVGVGINGASNRIQWSGVKRTTYTLVSVVSGARFSQSATFDVPDVQTELPADVRATVTYDADAWVVTGQVGSGFGGALVDGGLERRLGGLDVRGGMRYSFGMWNPSAGFGLPLSRTWSLDIAAFGTAANIERKRQLAIAASLRLKR